jgi:hypothetical protein
LAALVQPIWLGAPRQQEAYKLGSSMVGGEHQKIIPLLIKKFRA